MILWQRVSAGFNAPQQQELAGRLIGMLGLGARKAARLNPQMLRDVWRLVGGLERLDQSEREKLGDELIRKVRREPHNTSFAFAIGRLGARIPLYGPLSSVVGPDVAERWLDVLLALKAPSADAIAAIAQIGARTDDPARDIGEVIREAALARLHAVGAPETALRALREHMTVDRLSGARMLGESLPEGLRLG